MSPDDPELTSAAGLESDDAVRGAAYTQLASTEAPAEPHADSAA